MSTKITMSGDIKLKPTAKAQTMIASDLSKKSRDKASELELFKQLLEDEEEDEDEEQD